MIKHIVMWSVRGDDAATRQRNLALLKSEFESLPGCVPGLMHLEVGMDFSGVDYACDVVLYSEFASREALAAYADHPEHQRVKRALGDLRTARHQVDYEVAAKDRARTSPGSRYSAHHSNIQHDAQATADGSATGRELPGDHHVQAL